MDMIRTMNMSFSYKPVLLKAMLQHADDNGRVRVADIVQYFMDYYRTRKEQGKIVKKKTSIYCKDGYSKKEVELNQHVFKRLPEEWIVGHCERKLEEYYGRLVR